MARKLNKKKDSLFMNLLFYNERSPVVKFSERTDSLFRREMKLKRDKALVIPFSWTWRLFSNICLLNKKSFSQDNDYFWILSQVGFGNLCRKPESWSWKGLNFQSITLLILAKPLCGFVFSEKKPLRGFSLKLFQDPDSGFLHMLPNLEHKNKRPKIY